MDHMDHQMGHQMGAPGKLACKRLSSVRHRHDVCKSALRMGVPGSGMDMQPG